MYRNAELEEDLKVEDFDYGRGYRDRGQVVYDDHLTENQFVRVWC
jgi:hypothetical protein